MRYRASDKSFITHRNKLIELPAEALIRHFNSVGGFSGCFGFRSKNGFFEEALTGMAKH